jgi:transposase
MKRLALCLLCLCCNLSAWAQAQSNAQVSVPALVTSEDYQRIEAVRVREGSNFDAQEAACYERFAVNDCLKKVQTKRRALMADLKRQESALHARERQQQGAEALQRIEQKSIERQQRQEEIETENGADRAQDKLHGQQDKQAEHAAKAASGSAPVATPAPTGPSVAEQAEARASYERKLVDAENKRQEMIKRQTEKSGKPAKSLPLPP